MIRWAFDAFLSSYAVVDSGWNRLSEPKVASSQTASLRGMDGRWGDCALLPPRINSLRYIPHKVSYGSNMPSRNTERVRLVPRKRESADEHS